jgi:hypothetical protein
LRGSNVLGLAGVGMIAAAVGLFNSSTPFPGIPALLPVVGTVLVLVFATGGSAAARFLSLRPLVGLGLISYSVYLWHQPLFAFARYASDAAHLPVASVVMLLLASVGLGYLTWRLVEAPFRNSRLISQRVVWSVAFAGCAAVVAFGAAGHLSRGFADRYEMPAALPLAEFDLPRLQNGWCFYSVNSDRTLEIGVAGQGCDLGETERPLRSALLIGDSFAAQYEPFWDAVGQATDTRIRSVTTNWCHPALTSSFSGPVSDRAFRQCLLNRALLRGDLSDYDSVILGGHWANLVEAGLLDEVVALLEDLSARTDVDVVVMASPGQYIRRTVEATLFGMRPMPAIDPALEARAVAANAELETVAERLPRVTFMDREMLFDGAVTSEGLPYSFDGQHISVYGSLHAAERFLHRAAPNSDRPSP